MGFSQIFCWYHLRSSVGFCLHLLMWYIKLMLICLSSRHKPIWSWCIINLIRCWMQLLVFYNILVYILLCLVRTVMDTKNASTYFLFAVLEIKIHLTLIKLFHQFLPQFSSWFCTDLSAIASQLVTEVLRTWFLSLYHFIFEI